MGKRVVIGLFLAAVLTYLHAFMRIDSIPPDLGGRDGSIDHRVIQATSVFLQSNADAFLLFSEVEAGAQTGFDFRRGVALSDAAIAKLKRSREQFARVLAAAVAAEYDDAVLKRLRRFDYRGFAKSRNLIVPVMEKVGENLSHGDISGVLRKNLNHVDAIIMGMRRIRRLMVRETRPSMESIWRLLKDYSYAILYCNYVTLVFYNA